VLGFCIEASHARGLGHLYRTLVFIDYLAAQGEPYIVMVNGDPLAAKILAQSAVAYVTVNLSDFQSDWETALIKDFGIRVWINDRLDTDSRHAAQVKKNGTLLVTFDDWGTGAALADLHFAPLVFSGQDKLRGKRVLTGPRYLALNREIDACKRRRDRLDSILVTLGGSDTYGVTVQVVNLLKTQHRGATVVVGPAFRHQAELEQAMDANFRLKRGVPSLVQEFVRHDLAITGGGVTPFEANASGLPCIIVASELREIEIGQYLATAGSSVFAGYYREIDESLFSMGPGLNLKEMSRKGMAAIGTDGALNIFREIQALWSQP
jgi:spore coat polysaccharide biosynthesis predicted glycosyltransferase SpsG